MPHPLVSRSAVKQRIPYNEIWFDYYTVWPTVKRGSLLEGVSSHFAAYDDSSLANRATNSLLVHKGILLLGWHCQLTIFLQFLSEYATVALVRITGVRSNSFQVNFIEIANAAFYTIQVFLDDVMISEIHSSLTNVTVNGVDPINNVYKVQVAYNIQHLQSDFSPYVSTSKKSSTNFDANKLQSIIWMIFLSLWSQIFKRECTLFFRACFHCVKMLYCLTLNLHISILII